MKKMRPRAYYNDNDTNAAAALRQLIAENVIASGDVDHRSIKDVTADDLKGYTQCHFFAGGGLWSVAARLAGWPDERALWTASCPCQPLSVAGKRRGADDPRHLWPDLFRILRAACAAGNGPPVIMGEQVSGKAGYRWFDGVRADLARETYASRTRDIPACAVDAPIERNRLWWVAVAVAASECGVRPRFRHGTAVEHRGAAGNGHGSESLLAGPESIGGGRDLAQRRSPGRAVARRTDARVVGGPASQRREGLTITERSESAAPGRPDAQRADGRDGGHEGDVAGQRGWRGDADAGGRSGTFWSDAEWIICHDGKARRTKPGLPMLVDGLPGRVAAWRLVGNAISPILAAEVIGAFLDVEADRFVRSGMMDIA